jgi:hypothetical protein
MDVGAAGNMVQHTPSQEYVHPSEDEVEENEDVGADGLDMENEGFLDEPPKGRSSNYDVYEDNLICTAWKRIELDAAVGTEQTGECMLESDDRLLQLKHNGPPPINGLYSSSVKDH